MRRAYPEARVAHVATAGNLTSRPKRQDPRRLEDAMTSGSLRGSCTRGGPASAEEDLGLVEALLGDQLELGGRVSERDRDDVGAAQSGHGAPLTLLHRVDRAEAEAGREHPVERGRGAT